METMTMHVRLTKACNADCSYCSSWESDPSERMDPENFKRSLSYIWAKWKEKNIHPEFVTIEYVGGEILLIPQLELEEIVTFARKFFRKKGIELRDGVQSNLISSERKLHYLYKLFDGRIGTSFDNTTDQRTIKGSSKKYNDIFNQNYDFYKREYGKSIPGVFTLDKSSINGLRKELIISKKQSTDISIRPVFEGGSKNINSLTPKEVGEAFVDAFNFWFLKSHVVLHPHFELLEKWINDLENNSQKTGDLCPFQNNCAERSISLEPNGDLYVCQELGDTNDFRLGNAIYENWFENSWNVVSKRSENLNDDCKRCEFLSVCQGGCMMQAIQDGAGPYGKPHYCEAWKMIFSTIKNAVENNDLSRIKRWLKKIS